MCKTVRHFRTFYDILPTFENVGYRIDYKCYPGYAPTTEVTSCTAIFLARVRIFSTFAAPGDGFGVPSRGG